MKRIVVLEVDVKSRAELRRVARNVGYAAWAALDDLRKPVVKLATSARTTLALRAAWEAIPDSEQAP
jgi:hypothetical protein